jgi:hypothetical protein
MGHSVVMVQYEKSESYRGQILEIGFDSLRLRSGKAAQPPNVVG